MKRVFGILMSMTVMILMTTGIAAAEKPVVYLQPVCTYENSINNIKLDDYEQQLLGNMIREKLHKMAAEDELPYEIREMTADLHHSSGEQLLTDDRIFLYPTVMVSTAIDTRNNNPLYTAYTSTIVAGISLLFCVPEENLDPERVTAEGNTVSLRLLGIVPMVEAESIGIPEYDIQKDRWRNLRTEEITPEEKSRKIISLTRKMLKEDINFSNIKRNIKDDKAKMGMETYQVTDVAMSSQKARALFPEAEAEDLRFLVGYYFTSAYQKKTKRVVYPPAVGGEDLANSMIDSAYKLSLDSANGKVNVAMSNPKYPIRLDISGIASKVVESGKDVYTFLHKVWLAKKPVEGDEKAELSRLNTRTVKLPEGTGTDYDDKMIYSALLLGLAQELGSQDR